MIHDSNLPADLASWTSTLVKQYSLRAGARLGQHFLIDRKVLTDIISAAALDLSLPVLEVGGGFGVLTLALLEAGAQVTVVELDKKLAGALTKLANFSTQLKVVEGDVIKLRDVDITQQLGGHEFNIVANLPYEISGVFLRRFLSGRLRPRSLTLLLQREVGERLTARPGAMSLLSLLAAIACHKSEVVRLVPPSAFWPKPRVTSCLVRLELRDEAERAQILHGVAEARLWQLARIGFAARRKLLKNNLASALSHSTLELSTVFVAAHIVPTARAQELSLNQWVELAQALDQLSSAKP